MKNLCCLVILVLTATTLSAQEIKLKKGIVFVAEVPTFSFTKKAMGNELYIYKLNTNEELLYITVVNNNTESKVDDSKKLFFTKQNTTVATKNFRSQNYESILGLLLEEKVVDLKGEINTDNLKRFKAKYDDGNGFIR